ncbi:hypothetical protein ACR82Z_04135 [Mycoplasma sp. 6243]|uniref:hypothetical protein n=1 Tax=Mycoplasma sp. 6243 TaxID=3440865 RepID=UPI003EBBC98C
MTEKTRLLFRLNLATLILTSITMLFWIITTASVLLLIINYGWFGFNWITLLGSSITYTIFTILNLFVYLTIISLLISIFAITLQESEKDEAIARTKNFAISNFALILGAQLVSWIPVVSLIGLIIQIVITVLLAISIARLKNNEGSINTKFQQYSYTDNRFSSYANNTSFDQSYNTSFDSNNSYSKNSVNFDKFIQKKD